MKYFGLVLSAFFASTVAYYDSSIESMSTDDDEDGDMKTIVKTRSMIHALVCPDGIFSENPLCAGYEQKTFMNQLKKSFKNYGCNCFTDNSLHYRDDGSSYRTPQISGRPIDDVDGLCYNLNKRFHCFNVDRINGDIEDTCDYSTLYKYFIDDEGKIQCGKNKNKLYSNTGDSCRLALCEMEKEFAYSMAPIMQDPRQFRLDNAANYGVWSDTSVCARGGDYSETKDACCGKHSPAERIGYNSMSACCKDDKIESGMCV
jgi:hypothetical protein